jgi:ribose-phosphate pyrophosphokinase
MFDKLVFSGGEVHVRLKKSTACAPSMMEITADLYTSDDVMELLMIKDACDTVCESGAKSKLNLHYVPYGRQDRVCNTGEAFSVKVMANLINNLNFDEVVIYDPHSDVTSALLKNCHVVDHKSCFLTAISEATKTMPKYDAVVAPDSGATKKAFDLAKYMGVDLIQAMKIRDTASGQIIRTDVIADDLTGKRLLISDDLCDGGFTFLKLAEKLREQGAEKIDLYITHGIFSKGKDVFGDLIDNVYCRFDWTEQ